MTQVQKAESSFWNLPASGDFLAGNQSPQEKLKEINTCRSQWNPQGETQISCQFTKTGDYEVFVFSLGKKIKPLGQLKFHAL